MKRLTGIPASPGATLGKAFRLEENRSAVEKKHLSSERAEREKERFKAAVNKAAEQIGAIIKKLQDDGLENEAGIIEGQMMLLDDPQLSDDVFRQIEAESVNAEWAVSETFRNYAAMFEQMDDDYLRERANDIADVKQRVLGFLSGESASPLAGLTEPSVVVAHDLTPSVTSQLDKKLVLGFATATGSKTSHTSILARTMGIPAVVACNELLSNVKHGTELFLDGDEGVIMIEPDDVLRSLYEEKRKATVKEAEKNEEIRGVKAVTTDGTHIELAANIGRPSDAAYVHEHGGESVGLFRSEFLFMDRSSMPNEEEQFAAYRETAEKLDGKPMIVRTLDIGGDKSLDYLSIPHEMNPFLGWRAIRYCLAEKDTFRTQLRALLRAGVYGPISIMFPMISGLDELLAAKDQLLLAMRELDERGVEYRKDMKVGIMIEIPSAALTADLLAPHVDFFSIGTNDLIQYTIAVDRMNEKVSYLYNPNHLAVLRLIRMVCEAAEKHGKWVGMCGELAGDPAFTETLIGLGVTELSMSPAQIPKVKRVLLGLSAQAAKQKALSSLGCPAPVFR
ncbi:phosphoenolpyruvate--protein phosphotransferase [Paenibacillus alkalitolerans]|uniref:phosphoenolpyruvate--protein phosphotransferase n=1 Tax=Paenibacillus alkalitolerans TaxID=2799335 RepID=UPI0018F5AC0F|nr:phosphoenolpyruvate--protein phosphotransferase [Paenibacillus alkalitolerans]